MCVIESTQMRIKELEQQLRETEAAAEGYRAQRDALSARNVRLCDALDYANSYLNAGPLNTIGHGSKAHMEIMDALVSNPHQSLAEIKAQAIEEAADKLYGSGTVMAEQRRFELASYAYDLRQKEHQP